MNKVVLIGHLSKDPIVKTTKTGVEQSTFSIAVNDFKLYEETYFFNCVAWGSTAKYINNNLVKGQLVGIDGRLINRKYTRMDGSTSLVTDIIVDNIKAYGTIKKVQSNIESPNPLLSNEISDDEIFDVSKILKDENTPNDDLEEDLISWGDEE